MLCLKDIIICGLNKIEKDVLHIFTDITGFGQSRCIGNGEWNRQLPCKRSCKKRLSSACRSHHQDVGLVYLYLTVRMFLKVLHPLVMVVHSDGKNLLCFGLSNNIFIEVFKQFLWCGNILQNLNGTGSDRLTGTTKDLLALVHTFGTDCDSVCTGHQHIGSAPAKGAGFRSCHITSSPKLCQ